MDTLAKDTYNQFIDLAHTVHDELRYAVKTSDTSAALAYSYLRFSSPVQADGDSVRRQTTLRDAWLKRHPHVRLDTTLRLVDAGVSGYRGKHRKANKHALAHFLDLVERGRVPPGSYLIVENLDRLTREEPEESIPLVLNLIKAGIRIVQLIPTEMTYEPGMDFGKLMMMLWELARGHGESKRKSGLLGEAWREKKAEARKSGKPYGKMCPAWLELADGAYRLKADAAAAVRNIFQWSADGLGTFGILDRLNREGIPGIGRSHKWERSYIQKILASVAAMGWYQPHTGSRGAASRADGRKPEGEPVKGYYPAVIDESLWYAARAAIKRRARRSGRTPTVTNNPFSGMLYDALDGEKLHVCSTNGPAYRYLANNGAMQKRKGSEWRTFPLATFVEALLSELREVTASSVFADPGAERVNTLTARLDEVEKRLTVALEKFEADPESPTWSTKVDQYDKEKRALVKELTEATMEAENPLSRTWSEAVQLMAANEPKRLRSALLETTDKILVLIVSKGKERLAYTQVCFRGGHQRDYLIFHRQKTAFREGYWQCRSWRPDDLIPTARTLALAEPDAVVLLVGWLKVLLDDDIEKVFGQCERHPLTK